MNKKPTIFAEKIFYFENVIKNTENIIYLIEETNDSLRENDLISSWKPWHASNGEHFFGMKKSTNPDAINNANETIKMLYFLLDKTMNEYAEEYANFLNIPVGKKMPISISKYFLNAYMGPHTDSGPTPTTEHISAVLYLNDSYSGGEINFPEQGVKIKPSSGSIIFFPSIAPFYHESLPILHGVKYMSPAFWHLS
jgi:Rps23 Pro-64 3,4-dihydroxylase Tpa1-like proline 4-hydroxylase